jgi:tetratricopeptide (TPR) repeat protein
VIVGGKAPDVSRLAFIERVHVPERCHGTLIRYKPLEADELFVKALALDPNDAYVLDGYAIRIGTAGRLREALASSEKARAVEPFLPPMLQRATEFLWLNGRNDAAIALAKTLRPSDRAPRLAMIYASMGRYAEAANALTEIAGDPSSDAAQAARLLRTAPAKTTSPEKLPRLPRQLEFVYLHVGAPERAIDIYQRMADVGYLQGMSGFVWHSSYAPVRKTERFKALMRKAGLVEYWRAKGWPEFCHPTTGDDFACQ